MQCNVRSPFLCDAAAQAYLEEMAAMLIQAQGDSNTQAGQRLQRLTTELVRVCTFRRPQGLLSQLLPDAIYNLANHSLATHPLSCHPCPDAVLAVHCIAATSVSVAPSRQPPGPAAAAECIWY